MTVSEWGGEAGRCVFGWSAVSQPVWIRLRRVSRLPVTVTDSLRMLTLRLAGTGWLPVVPESVVSVAVAAC